MSPGHSNDDGSPNRDLQSHEADEDKDRKQGPSIKNIDYDVLREEEMLQLGGSTFPTIRRQSTKKQERDFGSTLDRTLKMSRQPSTKMLAASPHGEQVEIEGIFGKAASPSDSLKKSPSHE